MQFSEAIMEYSFDCKIRKLSAKTIENYQKQLRYLIIPVRCICVLPIPTILMHSFPKPVTA